MRAHFFRPLVVVTFFRPASICFLVLYTPPTPCPLHASHSLSFTLLTRPVLYTPPTSLRVFHRFRPLRAVPSRASKGRASQPQGPLRVPWVGPSEPYSSYAPHTYQPRAYLRHVVGVEYPPQLLRPRPPPSEHRPVKAPITASGSTFHHQNQSPSEHPPLDPAVEIVHGPPSRCASDSTPDRARPAITSG